MEHFIKTVMIFLGVVCCWGEAQEEKLLAIQKQPTELKFSRDSTDKLLVRGEDGKVRSSLLGTAIKVKQELYALLGIKDEDSQEVPIQVNLYGKAGDSAPETPFRKGVSFLIGKPHLTLDVHLARGVNDELFRSHMIELMLYEIGLRELGAQGEGGEKYSLPRWLALGVTEALKWKADRSDRALYARLFRQKAVYSVRDLLDEKIDGSEMGLMNHAFQVSSGVLVMALLNQTQGAEGLFALVKDSITYEGEPLQLISRHFPDTTLSQNSLSKWWALQVASMSQLPAEALQTISATERELDRMLTLSIPQKDGGETIYTPLRYSELKTDPSSEVTIEVTNRINELSLLQARAFPPYRPIIEGYKDILFSLVKIPKKKSFWSFFTKREQGELNITEMAERLANEREVFSLLGERVTDYLNWYQLELADSSSSKFRDYLELKQELAQPERGDKGPLSEYLNDIEKLYRE